MEPQKTPNSKNYFEQEEQSWRQQHFLILKEICNKNVKKMQQKNDYLKNSVGKSEYPYAEQ